MQVRLVTFLSVAMLAVPAAAQEAEKNWKVTVNGGTTSLAGAGDQPFASVGITRYLGDSYVRLGGTYIDSNPDTTAPSGVPASTAQLSLGAGTVTGPIAIDGYVTLGKREFDAQAFAVGTGRTIMIDSDGSTFGAGLALTYELPIGGAGVVAPFVAVDYSRISIARALTFANGQTVAEESREQGVTGSAGVTAAWLLGTKQQHSVGLYGAFLTSSNNSSYNGANAQRASALGIGDRPGVSDGWFEYGAIAALGLSDLVALNLGVVQTAGFLGPEATSFTGGLSVRF